jgi:nicotinate-nucleotide adenylyltransferase
MLKVGLFFGSFNPVHMGHLIIANYMADYTHLDEIWFVISPQNPFKSAREEKNFKKNLKLKKNG